MRDVLWLPAFSHVEAALCKGRRREDSIRLHHNRGIEFFHAGLYQHGWDREGGGNAAEEGFALLAL